MIKTVLKIVCLFWGKSTENYKYCRNYHENTSNGKRDEKISVLLSVVYVIIITAGITVMIYFIVFLQLFLRVVAKLFMGIAEKIKPTQIRGKAKTAFAEYNKPTKEKAVYDA